MNDLNELMRQAKQMQEQLQKAQREAAAQVVTGESGAGLVRIFMNGRHDVVRVELDDGLMSEDKEVVEDLLAAAINDAVKKIEEQGKNALSGMAAGLKLPEGFKFPF